jgi:hypothetical protein
MNLCQAAIIAAILTVLLILSPLLCAAEETYSGAAELINCRFDEAWDENYDGWPDAWQRRVDETYPGYVDIKIEPDENATSGRSLTVKLDGGSAYFRSPDVPVSPLYSYLLVVRAQCEGIEHADAAIGIVWQDKDGAPVGSPTRISLANSAESQDIRIGPVSPPEPSAEKAAVFVQIDRGKQIDLGGLVVVEEVHLVRLPQVVLSPEKPLGLFTDPREVAIRCRMTGVSRSSPAIHFELRSVEGEIVDEGSPDAKDIVVRESPIELPAGAQGDPSEPREIDYQVEALWKPKYVEYGFYRVHATLIADGAEGERRTTSIAVLRPFSRPAKGIFGWSVASIGDPHSTDDWAQLLTQMGIHWAKFPVWYDAAQSHVGDELVQFTERLAAFGIEVVGVVDRAPSVEGGSARLLEAGSIADIFALDSSYWLPLLDPVMTRLSLRIRWWQFGSDRDTSLVGYPELPALIETVRQQLYRFGQKVNVGIPWKWMAAPPEQDELPWQFIQWSADPPLTGSELAANLRDGPEEMVNRWVLVDPLPRNTYSLSTRVADLIQQMLAARLGNADAAFLPHPIDSSRGVLDDDGAPDEMLLPFRTTAMLLADAQHIGSMRLPSNSENRVFRKPDQSLLMVVWSDGPATEELFLGENIVQIDPWGRDIPFDSQADRQAIRVSDVPSFVLGLNELATTIRISAAFEHERLPSVFGRPHDNALVFVNSLPQGIGGEVTPVGSTGWAFAPDRLAFKAAAGAPVRIPFQLAPRSDASSGRQEVRLDFEIQAAQRYKFSVWKHFDIGLGDIEIEISTVLHKDGTLVVEQRTQNHTDQLVDFKCLLYAQNRRRQRNHIFRLGRGQDLQHYRFSNAEDLIGTELWLRCEEIGGQRVFNYRHVVER